MPRIYDSISSVSKIVREAKPSAVFLVTSNKLEKKLGATIRRIQRQVPKLTILTMPDGEAAKEWREIEILLKAFMHAGADRHALVLTLGGGTVGDSVGFACSVYLRGIRYVQIPTTLLAQVDSAHGGKTAVNIAGLKNQGGSMHEPVAIIVDPHFLSTNSEKLIIDGLGEIIKYGLIKDASILRLLEGETVASLSKGNKLAQLIKKSIAVKAFYSKNDYHDRGIRQLLNFGHTIGHAIEIKHRLSHGEAVIAGMVRELDIAEKLAFTMPGAKNRLLILLKNLGITPHVHLEPDWDALRRDKKVREDCVTLPVIMKEGRANLVEIKLSEFKRAFNATK